MPDIKDIGQRFLKLSLFTDLYIDKQKIPKIVFSDSSKSKT